ncbi:hypothetical protein AK812_SmicGene37647 [Symbiodinium microadriaticum]|uniref:Uncharacterized protein n=1 Tax=Symbiodinium microadriaticum TaxID=2951 RepID=A0A1Q9CFS1_SYMMI|nr:hypothetical protein AK812_SmicGene37647 [Symbiodinium microadriaticum]
MPMSWTCHEINVEKVAYIHERGMLFSCLRLDALSNIALAFSLRELALTTSLVVVMCTGSWLVLEKWMAPDLFAAEDEWTLLSSGGQAVRDFRRTFITEQVHSEDWGIEKDGGIGALMSMPKAGTVRSSVAKWGNEKNLEIVRAVAARWGHQKVAEKEQTVMDRVVTQLETFLLWVEVARFYAEAAELVEPLLHRDVLLAVSGRIVVDYHHYQCMTEEAGLGQQELAFVFSLGIRWLHVEELSIKARTTEELSKILVEQDFRPFPVTLGYRESVEKGWIEPHRFLKQERWRAFEHGVYIAAAVLVDVHLFNNAWLKPQPFAAIYVRTAGLPDFTTASRCDDGMQKSELSGRPASGKEKLEELAEVSATLCALDVSEVAQTWWSEVSAFKKENLKQDDARVRSLMKRILVEDEEPVVGLIAHSILFKRILQLFWPQDAARQEEVRAALRNGATHDTVDPYHDKVMNCGTLLLTFRYHPKGAEILKASFLFDGRMESALAREGQTQDDNQCPTNGGAGGISSKESSLKNKAMTTSEESLSCGTARMLLVSALRIPAKL